MNSDALSRNTVVYLERLSDYISTLNFEYNHSYSSTIDGKFLVTHNDKYTINISMVCNGCTLKEFQDNLNKLSNDIQDDSEKNTTDLYLIKKKLVRLREEIFIDDSYIGPVFHRWANLSQNEGKVHSLEFCPPIEEEIRSYYFEVLDNLDPQRNPSDIEITAIQYKHSVEQFIGHIYRTLSLLISKLEELAVIVSNEKRFIGNEVDSKVKVRWNDKNAALGYLLVQLEKAGFITLPKHNHDKEIDYSETIRWVTNSFRMKRDTISAERFRKDMNTMNLGLKNQERVDKIVHELKKFENLYNN